MAKLSRSDLEEIIERDLPGYALAPGEGAGEYRPPVEADDASPELDALRKKYLGDEASPGGDYATSGEEDVEDEIVTVHPKGAGDPFDSAARPKTVVVSGSDRRVIGSQG